VLWILIFDTLLYCAAKNWLVNDREWNQQSGFALLKTNSHFLTCRSCSNCSKVTWRLQLQCDVVFMASSPSNSPRFSLLAIIFWTTVKKITSLQFQQHLKKHLCVVEPAFAFSFSPIPQLSQYHRPNSLSPCSVKTPQCRVRKCVHEGKPRATNCSCVNLITLQCKVGKC